MVKVREDLTGQQFDRLKVVDFVEIKTSSTNNLTEKEIIIIKKLS